MTLLIWKKSFFCVFSFVCTNQSVASGISAASNTSTTASPGGDKNGQAVAIRALAVTGNLIQRRKLSDLLKEQCLELADLKKMAQVHVVKVFILYHIRVDELQCTFSIIPSIYLASWAHPVLAEFQKSYVFDVFVLTQPIGGHLWSLRQRIFDFSPD